MHELYIKKVSELIELNGSLIEVKRAIGYLDPAYQARRLEQLDQKINKLAIEIFELLEERDKYKKNIPLSETIQYLVTRLM